MAAILWLLRDPRIFRDLLRTSPLWKAGVLAGAMTAEIGLFESAWLRLKLLNVQMKSLFVLLENMQRLLHKRV